MAKLRDAFVGRDQVDHGQPAPFTTGGIQARGNFKLAVAGARGANGFIDCGGGLCAEAATALLFSGIEHQPQLLQRGCHLRLCVHYGFGRGRGQGSVPGVFHVAEAQALELFLGAQARQLDVGRHNVAALGRDQRAPRAGVAVDRDAGVGAGGEPGEVARLRQQQGLGAMAGQQRAQAFVLAVDFLAALHHVSLRLRGHPGA